jgi:ATP-dependent Clp protease ATP-binding subunit ClpB
MLEGEREKLVKMEERLQKRVVGQKAAITAVANAVRRSQRFANPTGPSARSYFGLPAW